MVKKIRLGILGTGSIVKRIMADIHKGENYELTAFASRTPGRAREFADRYGARLAFDSYEAMAESSQIDLVYVASLNNRHREHTELMLSHGKHVICEKPFALNDAEATDMISLAREKRLFLMEAMWTRFLPAVRDLKVRVEGGELGEILAVTANFNCNTPFDPESRLFNLEKSGGALMDIGVYPLSFAVSFLGAHPDSISTVCRKAPTGVDTCMAIQMTYKNGAFAQIHTAVDMSSEDMAIVHGSQGYAVVPDFWHATKYTLHTEAETREFRFPPENEGHHHEFVHAADCICAGLTESPVLPLGETLEIMKLLTQMRRENGVIYPEERHNAEA